MLTKIIPGEVTPVSARAASRVHPLPDLGSGKPAGASGKTGRGTVGTAAPVELTTDPAGLDLTRWGKWLALAEELAGHSLDGDDNAYPAFERGVYPEVYVGALAEPCEKCATPGAPSHDPSPRCHYRPRVVNHCTCSACF